ncbi:MAG: hypothetical protein U0935_21750 [Pirellulales bacterium]
MGASRPSQPPLDVDQLLLNASLRDALEPFVDESLDLLDAGRMSTADENDFLASLLAWERAPVEPISRWFQPELVLPPPGQLDDVQLHQLLWETIERLYQRRITLHWTDHLTDRSLYAILRRDLLPAYEKRIDDDGRYLQWRFLDVEQDTELWLRYYATDEERVAWAQETGERLPPADRPPYPRELPQPPHGE